MQKYTVSRFFGLTFAVSLLVHLQPVSAATNQQILNQAMSGLLSRAPIQIVGNFSVNTVSKMLTTDGIDGSGSAHARFMQRVVNRETGVNGQNEGQLMLDKLNSKSVAFDAPLTINWKHIGETSYIQLEHVPSAVLDLFQTINVDPHLIVGQWISLDQATSAKNNPLNALPLALPSSMLSSSNMLKLAQNYKELNSIPLLTIKRVEKKTVTADGHTHLRLRVSINPSVLTTVQRIQLKNFPGTDAASRSARANVIKEIAAARKALAALHIAVDLDVTTGSIQRIELGHASATTKQTCSWNARLKKEVCHHSSRDTTTIAVGVSFVSDNGHAVSTPETSTRFQDLINKLTPPSEPTPAEPAPEEVPPTEPTSVFPENLKPVDTLTDHIAGQSAAKVTLIEYSDFECPFCKAHFNTMNQVLAAYPNEVRLVYRHFPLSFHQNAQKEAEASECVASLGGNQAFWNFYATIYTQTESSGTGFPLNALGPAAAAAGVDEAAFQTCLDSGKFAGIVMQQVQDGEAAGVQGTPTTFVNGKRIEGAVPFEMFKQEIDAILMK